MGVTPGVNRSVERSRDRRVGQGAQDAVSPQRGAALRGAVCEERLFRAELGTGRRQRGMQGLSEVLGGRTLQPWDRRTWDCVLTPPASKSTESFYMLYYSEV